MLAHAGKCLCLALILMRSLQALGQERAGLVRGRVTDAKTNLPLAGANVMVPGTAMGTATDSLGCFSLALKRAEYTLTFSRVGYVSVSRTFVVVPGRDTPALEISLMPTAYFIREVTVSGRGSPASRGIHSIEEKNLQNIPNIYGDVIRSLTILPGVTSDNELTSAYNVRGQNFDANLIYLDGFEIYRPFLVQQGIEENQSPVNQNMVGGLEFFDGAFPAQYGDKMASVLVVNYKKEEVTGLGGEANADLLNLGLTLHDRIRRLSLVAGFRYAYPSFFTEVLQTKGTYLPRFTDFQLLGNYDFSNDIRMELLFMTAKNTFDLTPRDWTGDFAVGAWDAFRRIVLKFSGRNTYTYGSSLLGLRLTAPVGKGSVFSASVAYYSDRESYDENLPYGVYYSPDSYNPADKVNSLATGFNFAGNSLDMNRIDLKSDFRSNYGILETMAGFTVRTSVMDNLLNEWSRYDPPPGPLDSAYQAQDMKFNSISGYVSEMIYPDSRSAIDLGVRALKYYFTHEFLLSLRLSASFTRDSVNSLSVGWGFYYQPPYFYETRDKTPAEAQNLVSQRAIHYQMRYQRMFRDNAQLLAEVYYKSMDYLLPYDYTNQLELTYGDTNNYNGYAYGFDLQYKAKLSQRLDTWIGYG